MPKPRGAARRDGAVKLNLAALRFELEALYREIGATPRLAALARGGGL